MNIHSLSRNILPRIRRTAGFSIVTAIFILLIFALMAVALVSLFTTSQQQSALDVQGARAYQAARAGIEWGLYQHLRLNANCAGSNSFALPAGSSLSTFSVSVTCVQTPAGALTPTTRRQLTAIACNRPAPGNVCPNPVPNINSSSSADYVQRKVQVEF